MMAEGVSKVEIIADYPCLALEDICACLTYAASVADHPTVFAA
jgi:uncharacterized protein (DUF433 family)